MALVIFAVYGRRVLVRPARWLTPRRRSEHRVGLRPTGLKGWILERWVLVFTLLACAVVLAWATTSAMVVRSSVIP